LFKIISINSIVKPQCCRHRHRRSRHFLGRSLVCGSTVTHSFEEKHFNFIEIVYVLCSS
jgi:hypothetical protein